jgi:hypothetical protein
MMMRPLDHIDRINLHVPQLLNYRQRRCFATPWLMQTLLL